MIFLMMKMKKVDSLGVYYKISILEYLPTLSLSCWSNHMFFPFTVFQMLLAVKVPLQLHNIQFQSN